MSYIDTLSNTQKKNISKVTDSLIKSGINNPYSVSAILSIASKESGLTPITEKSYANTPVSRIRSIFGSRVSKLTDSQLETLKKNDVAFFDQVYGSQWKSLGLGNSEPGDGYKYRGRGFNQITGRYAYTKYGKLIGQPIDKNPDLLNDPSIAAAVLSAFLKNVFASSNNKLSLYNSKGVNDFKNLNDATLAFYHANAGWNKDMTSDPTGGKKKALQRAPEFYEYIKNFDNLTFVSVGLSLFLGFSIGAVIYYIYSKTRKK